MKKISPVFLNNARLLVMTAGVLVSWSTTIDAFAKFYRIEGTIFKIKDCAIPNPVTTPCFWGALAFFIGTIWAYKLLQDTNRKKETHYLYFMIFSVIFAWSNFAIELKGVQPQEGALLAPCPANQTSPFLSACFFGSILFTLSLLFTYRILKKSKREA